jgi:hypothetical protein
LITLFGLATTSVIRRDNTVENVVLANCVDQNGIKSSQMAYYVTGITSSPTTVAGVSTEPGQTQTWEGTGTISAVYQNGVYFNVTIPHPVANGAYAGMGQNNYGNFSCWYDNTPSVYNWGNNSCDMIYDCNHQAAPSSTPSTTGTEHPTSTPTGSNANTNPSATATMTPQEDLRDGSGKSLSKGNVAGIVIGSIAALTGVVALVIAALERWKKLP